MPAILSRLFILFLTIYRVSLSFIQNFCIKVNLTRYAFIQAFCSIPGRQTCMCKRRISHHQTELRLLHNMLATIELYVLHWKK